MGFDVKLDDMLRKYLPPVLSRKACFLEQAGEFGCQCFEVHNKVLRLSLLTKNICYHYIGMKKKTDFHLPNELDRYCVNPIVNQNHETIMQGESFRG